jgi:hypothetical protein
MSKFDVKMSVEDAVMAVEQVIDDCFVVKGFEKYFTNRYFISKIKTDKELQKALLVLIKG